MSSSAAARWRDLDPSDLQSNSRPNRQANEVVKFAVDISEQINIRQQAKKSAAASRMFKALQA